MKPLKQQFIIEYMRENNFHIPNSFLRDDVVDIINRKGFDLKGEANFRKGVEVTNKRYPGRFVVPFAGRRANDDVVAFLISPKALGEVILFHGFTEPGYEGPIYYPTLEDWLENSE